MRFCELLLKIRQNHKTKPNFFRKIVIFKNNSSFCGKGVPFPPAFGVGQNQQKNSDFLCALNNIENNI